MDNKDAAKLNLRHFDECYTLKGDRRVAIGTAIKHQRFELLKKLLPGNSLILDQGCGAGYVAQCLLEEGHRVDCFDISPVAIRKCKEFFTLAGFSSKRYNLWIKAYSNFDYPKSKYDGVVDLYSLHFIPHEKQKEIIDKVYKALKTDGYFFFAVMLIGSIKIKEPYSKIAEDGATLLKIDDVEAYRCFYLWDPFEVRKVLEDLGFKIIHFYHPFTSIEFICQK